jgi:hypothetical protein
VRQAKLGEEARRWLRCGCVTEDVAHHAISSGSSSSW